MDREQFWALVEAAKAATDGDCQAQTAQLVAALRQRSVSEVLDYDRIHDELMAESYRWDLWGAAYLINGGCSDDGFDYFRGWLLTQGRATWEAAVADPDSLAAHPQVRARSRQGMWAGSLWCEDVLGAAYEAYEAVTGREFTAEVAAETPWDAASDDEEFRWARTSTSTMPKRCADATPGSGRYAAGTRRRQRRLDTNHGGMS